MTDLAEIWSFSGRFLASFAAKKVCLEGQKWSKRVSRGQESTPEISIPLKLGKLTKFGLPGSKNTDFCWNLMIFGAVFGRFWGFKGMWKGPKRLKKVQMGWKIKQPQCVMPKWPYFWLPGPWLAYKLNWWKLATGGVEKWPEIRDFLNFFQFFWHIMKDYCPRKILRPWTTHLERFK